MIDLEKIKEQIKTYVNTKQDMDKYGEVFTPISLVNEMLDKLPKEVWYNPDLKWLDPANGIGNFPVIVVSNLMDGLKEWQPDLELRLKHILENMIYVCELQPKNMIIYLQLFNSENKYKLNYHIGSFLDEGFSEVMKEWGVDKFDVVVGNPPYQELKTGNKKSQSIWDKFVKKTDLILNINGFFVYIHPIGWRSPKGNFRPIYDIYINYDILYLNLNDFKKGSETFGVGTNYDLYVIRKSNNKILTKIIDIDDIEYNIDIKDFIFIPNGKFELFNKLIAKEGEEKVSFLYNRSSYGTDKSHMSKEKSEEFKYPCVYTITQKDGINLLYSNTNKNGHFGIPKIIWSNGLGTYPIVDINGIYGLTQFSYAIIDNIDNLENIKDALNSKEFINLISYVRFTNNKYDYKVISTFKKDFWKEFI